MTVPAQPSAFDPARMNDWRCPTCDYRFWCRIHERKPDGSFGLGPQIRCLNCKDVFDPPLTDAVIRPDGAEDDAAFVERMAQEPSHIHVGYGNADRLIALARKGLSDGE